MVYNLDGVTLTQGQLDIVVAALSRRAARARTEKSTELQDADSALQKFLAVERAALVPTVTP